MSELAKFDAYKKKLQGICDENNLVFRFRHDNYPITLTIRPISGVAEQMCMMEMVEEKGYISPDAYIVFAYKDGDLTYKTSETFTISDVLFSKIKNLYKNMHSLWVQYFFRTILEKGVLSASDLPRIDEKDTSPDDGSEDNSADDLEVPEPNDEDGIPEIRLDELDDDSAPDSQYAYEERSGSDANDEA